ncbi:MAG: TlpA disulfide reductase family protein [Acidimicrobiales bacterium]
MTKRNNAAKAQPANRRPAQADAARRAHARRRNLRAGLVAGGVAIVAIVVAFAVTSSSGGPGVTDPARFDLPAFEGTGRVELASFKGKPVVVNFFASWCSSCRSELPGFSKLAKQLDGEVAFVGVNSLETGDGAAMAREFDLKNSGFTLAKDIGGANHSGLHDALGATGMPATAFYDGDGRLVTTELSVLSEPALRQKLHDLYGIDV